MIVEDGTGKANAESPQSIDDLDAYHLANNNAGWVGSTAAKEAAARKASRFLEARWGGRLLGWRHDLRQALSYPRSGSLTRFGKYVDPNTVPREWKAAHAELALRALAGSLAPDQTKDRALIGQTIGPISKQWSDRAAIYADPTYPEVEDALAPLLAPVGQLLRC